MASLHSIFSKHATLDIVQSLDHDVWLRTIGLEQESDEKAKIGTFIRLRTWAGGGQNLEAQQAAFDLMMASEIDDEDSQMTLADQFDLFPLTMVAPQISSQMERRYIPCDDEIRAHYLQLFLVREEYLMGLRTAKIRDDGKPHGIGPVVWFPFSPEGAHTAFQDALHRLYQNARPFPASRQAQYLSLENS